ncbi:MAG: hypothetical protein JWO91_737 [Acidobacteriaceae bacterium]|nr:hypothetical protein [Acidobacteriaceae bacterium]
MFEKAFYTAGAIGGLLILSVVVAYWWSGSVLSRPKAVSPRAVFLWAPNVGLPAPRRGSRIACSEDAGHHSCTLYLECNEWQHRILWKISAV